MKDEYRFITPIHIDNQKFPEIKEDNLGSLIASYVDKMAIKRVKAFNIGIIDNIREIGRENGIDLLAVIDEEKLLNMVLRLEKQDKALEIIKEKDVNVYWFRYVHKRHKEIETRSLYLNSFQAYNGGVKVERRLTEEEYDLLKEVLL